MGWVVKYHPVRGGYFGGASADPGRGFAPGAAAVPRGGHGCAAGLRWVRVPGTWAWRRQGNCRWGRLIARRFAGARVVGRRLCIAIFEGVEGVYRAGLCVRM